MLKTLLFCASVTAALASVNNCPNATHSSAVFTGVTFNTDTIPGSGPGNSLADLGASGCTATDLAFTNFNGSFAGTSLFGKLTATGTYVAETPAGTGDPTIAPDRVIVAAVRGTAVSNTDGDNNDGNNNFIGGSGVVDQINFNVSRAAGGNPNALVYGIVLNVYDQQVASAGPTNTIALDVCSGSGITGMITSASACGSAGGTFFSTSITLTGAGTSGGNLSSLLGVGGGANLDVTVVYTAPTAVGFSDFSLDFVETPEPGTFSLFGSALFFLGLWVAASSRGSAQNTVAGVDRAYMR